MKNLAFVIRDVLLEYINDNSSDLFQYQVRDIGGPCYYKRVKGAKEWKFTDEIDFCINSNKDNLVTWKDGSEYEGQIKNIVKEETDKIIYDLLCENVDREDYEFVEETLGSTGNQVDVELSIVKDGVKKAYLTYALLNDVPHIQYIESLDKGKGYGPALIKRLASLYGYENIERGSMTDDGSKMMKKLDKEFNFDPQKNEESKYESFSIDEIETIESDNVKSFLNDVIKKGQEKAFSDLINDPMYSIRSKRLDSNYGLDFNDVAEIAKWVKGSKIRSYESKEIPHPVMQDFFDLGGELIKDFK